MPQVLITFVHFDWLVLSSHDSEEEWYSVLQKWDQGGHGNLDSRIADFYSVSDANWKY